MDGQRTFDARIDDRSAWPRAGVLAIALVAVIGIGLLPALGDDGDDAALRRSPEPARTTSSAQPTALPPNRSWSTMPASALVGFIGLPPAGATPSGPEVGTLVDSYPVHGGGRPFEGSVRLYADGRLIWYMFYDGPSGRNGHSTGYLEQRLTPDGLELVRSHDSLSGKDPLKLPEWLPASAWADQRIRPYVPGEFAVCLTPEGGGVYPAPGPAPERSPLLARLPPTAEELLRDRETVPTFDDGWVCVALPTDEAHILDRVLRSAKLQRIQREYVLGYRLDTPDMESTGFRIYFEPRFPDGTHGCSACG